MAHAGIVTNGECISLKSYWTLVAATSSRAKRRCKQDISSAVVKKDSSIVSRGRQMPATRNQITSMPFSRMTFGCKDKTNQQFRSNISNNWINGCVFGLGISVVLFHMDRTLWVRLKSGTWKCSGNKGVMSNFYHVTHLLLVGLKIWGRIVYSFCPMCFFIFSVSWMLSRVLADLLKYRLLPQKKT